MGKTARTFLAAQMKPRGLTTGERSESLSKVVGGEGGIRTPDTVARMPHFECGAIDHSATSPWPGRARKTPVGRAGMYPRRPGETRAGWMDPTSRRGGRG